jgi:hypothetical protein
MLTIDRLVVRGKVPRRSNVDRTLIDRITREEFAVECGRQLKRPWPVKTRVARIRELRIRVSIPAKQLRPDTFVKAWTAAFLRELFAALAHLHNVEIVQFQSRAAYVATAIRDLLNGVDGQRWAYEEFDHLFDTSVVEAVLSLFKREQAQVVPILLILEDWGLLDHLLAVWDEAGLQQFLVLVAGENRAKRLSIKDLIRVAELLLEYRPPEIQLPGSSGLADRKIALKLFLSLARRSNGTTTIQPETIFEALRILRALLNLLRSTASRLCSSTGSGGPEGELVLPIAALSGLADNFRHSIEVEPEGNQTAVTELLNILRTSASASPYQDLLNEFWSMIAIAPDSDKTAFAEVLHKLTSAVSSDAQRQQIAELWNIIAAGSRENRMALAALPANLTSAPGHGTEPKWVSTDCAGLFFLVRVLDKLGWEDRLAESALGATYGPRLLTYTLAGVAAAILDRFEREPTYVDSGIALFSGWMDAPDLRGLHAFLAAASVETRQDLLGGMLTQESAIEYSATWQTCFDALANYLIREFTNHIRCFGKPSRSFVVRNFVALPGRILIEKNRLVIMFTSSPLHVVIHLSGLDDPVQAVDWLGGRRIEFQADGF